MIVELREHSDTTDRTPTLAVRGDDGTWHEFEADDVAEAITLPGGQVQVIDMTGERGDPIVGSIVAVTGTEWSVWVARGDDVTRYDEQSHVQQNPGGSVVRIKEDGHTTHAGTAIRRAKRTQLIE